MVVTPFNKTVQDLVGLVQDYVSTQKTEIVSKQTDGRVCNTHPTALVKGPDYSKQSVAGGLLLQPDRED